jgi:hypothetical protein
MTVPEAPTPGGRLLMELAPVKLHLGLDSFTPGYVKQPEFKKRFGSTEGV